MDEKCRAGIEHHQLVSLCVAASSLFFLSCPKELVGMFDEKPKYLVLKISICIVLKIVTHAGLKILI